MSSIQSSPTAEAQTVSMEALMAAVQPFFRSITPKEWMGLSNGDPEPSTTCALQETFGDILELFTSNVLQSLHKDSCTMKDLKAAVGNKVPEAFAKLLEIDGDIITENTHNLNRLMVQYLMGRVNDSLDSGAPNHVDQAAGMSMIRHMVDETSLILQGFLEKSEFKKPASCTTCEPKKIEGLMGKIKRFFRTITGKRSSKVAPLIVQEQQEISLTENRTKLKIQVEDVDNLSDTTGCVAEAQPAKDNDKTTTTAAVIPLDDQGTTDIHREEPEVDLISPAEPFDPLDIDADVENSVPESQSTVDPQELEGQPKLDEVSPTEAVFEPEILLAENLLENKSEPEPSSVDSSDDSSSSFTLSGIEWDSQTSTSSALDDDGNEELTGSHVCSEEERKEMVSHLPGFIDSCPVQHFICEGMIPGELDEPETESTSESEEDQESEEVERRKTALQSLVRDVITMIIDMSGQRDYPPEEYKAILDRLFEKLWVESKHTILNMSPDAIRRQGKPIFKDLQKGCSKPENILLLLEAGTKIMERNVLTTMENRLQPRWKMIGSIKKAFGEALENLGEKLRATFTCGCK